MDQSNRSVHGTLAKIGVEPGKVEAKKVYRIDARDAFAVYCDNAEFRFAINTGMFRHAQNRFVIDNEKYVYRTPGGVYRLTQYAWGHLDECALVFVDRWAFREPPKVMYRRVFPYRSEPQSRYEYLTDTNVPAVERAAVYKAAFEEEYELIAATTKTFSVRVTELMELRGWDVHKFTTHTGLEPNHYWRIVRGETNSPSLESVLSICIGLQLPTAVRDELIALAGRTWQTSRIHAAYRFILEHEQIKSVTDFNRFFSMLDVAQNGKLPLQDNA